MSRWLDRFCAVVTLGIAILSLRGAYLAFVAGAAGGGLVFDLPSLGRFALFGAGGLACVAGAAWLLSRRAPEAAGRDASQARLFGRGATIARPASRLPLRAIVLAVPVVMAAALAADWSLPVQVPRTRVRS